VEISVAAMRPDNHGDIPFPAESGHIIQMPVLPGMENHQGGVNVLQTSVNPVTCFMRRNERDPGDGTRIRQRGIGRKP
jgi:hypothetical protein